MSQDNTQIPNNFELPNVREDDSVSANTDSEAPIQSSATGAIFKTTDDPLPQIQQSPPQQSDNQTQSGGISTSLSTSTTTPAIADDVDLIEKEWVEKAKEIVNKTKDNPYLQNKAISEMKADYIKKRYNKDLSKSDE